MPAEINRGGHWVLHCDSRADRPTATPIHVTIFAKLPRFDKNRGSRSQESRGGRVLKDWRRKIEIQVKAPSDSSARVPKIGDKEDRILGSATDRNSSTQPPRRRRREDRSVCFASRKSEEIEDARERLPIAWNSQKSEEKERVESRLRDDETEQSCLAIADSIARRRSLQDRSQTRRDSSNLDTSRTTFDYPGRTRITEDRSLLLSSHRSRTRFSTERSLKDNLQKDVERSLDEELDNRDSRRRVDDDDDDEGVRSVKERTGRIGQDRRRIGNGRVRSFLQLVLLLFLVAFGQRGLGSSSVIKLSARPTASILGIGAIIGAVSAGSIDLAGDASTRAERSANLSHITGASRKIQMYIKNRHLQILPDGTVNGSNDDTSDYTIFQRTSVSRGQLRIQGVATCLYLCMDSCGLLYGSREYTEDCVFNETLEQHNYNTYSSIRWSTAKRTMYLGLNRFGQPRKVLAKGHNLGRLSGYARVLTQMAPFDRVEALHRRMLGAAHNVRHRHHERGHHRVHPGDVAQQSICPTIPEQEKDGRDRFRCRKRKKRKKRRRRCRPGEQPGPQCRVAEGSDVDASSEAGNVSLESKRSCEGAASEEACRRQALSVPAKKRKSRIDDDDDGGNLTLNNGKNNKAKKPNVNVADSQSKKPDLTDGKKTKRKGPSSQKQYESATVRVSSPRMAPISEVLTATSSSSQSPPGASTVLSFARRPSSPPSGRRKPPSSSRNSRRKGKSFSNSPARSKSTPTMSEIDLPSATKVPETTSAWSATSIPQLPQSSPVPASSSSLWRDSSAEDSTNSLSNFLLVESTEMVESTAEVSTLRLDEKDDRDNDSNTTGTRSTTRFPIERLAM